MVEYTLLSLLKCAAVFLKDLLSCLRKGDWRALTHLTSVADGSFARWYSTYGMWLTFLLSPSKGIHNANASLQSGHHFARQEESLPIPALVHSAHGIVLELGACTGNQLPRLDKSKLTQVYGIEPNTWFEPALTKRIAEHGLTELYTPVWTRFEDAGAELERLGVEQGTVDCVICIQVLCSTSDPAESVRECWRWLKPGGELLFCEHGANKDWITRIAQRECLLSC